jgi:hypothetical protein
MSTKADYRANAEDCLRKAQAAQYDEERPFWLNLAQSWLQLAQYSTRSRAGLDTNQPEFGPDELDPIAQQRARTGRPQRRRNI